MARTRRCSRTRSSTSSATARCSRRIRSRKQQVDTQEALVRQYEGAVQSDQGAIDSAKLQLTYARVTAPISGRVGLRQVDPGNIVHASDANGLVVIAQLQPVTVVFPIPEDNVPRVMKRLAGRRGHRRRRLGSRPEGEARDRQAVDGRQPDRHDHRHRQAEGGIRQRRISHSFRTSSSTSACWCRPFPTRR